MTNTRDTRYQGAILRGDSILLIKHSEHASGRSYWIIPGGGREPDETEEACVLREMLEETNLQVSIVRLLLDESGIPMGHYKRLKTYLCKEVGGEARPGYEPEEEAASQYAISEVRWFDLRDPSGWDAQLQTQDLTHSLMLRIRAELGYSEYDQ